MSTSLGDFLQLDDDWIYENANISIKDHAAAVLVYSIRPNWSQQVVHDLLKLLEIHMRVKNNIIKSVQKLRLKNDTDCSTVNYVEYCQTCNAIWPTDERQIKYSTAGCLG